MTAEYSKKTIQAKMKIAKDIVKELTNIASIDNKITDEEIGVIMNIKRNLDSYFSLVDKMNEGDVLTRSEEMHIIEKKIIQDATAKAFEDGKITDDERKLLTRLSELMESIAKTK